MLTYGYWPESKWYSEKIDWRKAKKITAGVDIGSNSSQAAVFCDGELFAYASIHTGSSFANAATKVMEEALGDSGLTIKDINGGIVSTGWGHKHVKYANKTMDEVSCHAKGARFIFGPEVNTVVDLGAQTVAAIRLYHWDRVWDFMMNDKCATGMGANLEVVCEVLQVPIDKIGELSLDVEFDPEPVSTTCFSFAATETFGLFGRPEPKSDPLTENQVYASHLFAIVWRTMAVIGKIQPLDIHEPQVYERVGFTGGLAKNVGITKRLERELKTEALPSKYDPQLAGAIGAALLA